MKSVFGRIILSVIAFIGYRWFDGVINPAIDVVKSGLAVGLQMGGTMADHVKAESEMAYYSHHWFIPFACFAVALVIIWFKYIKEFYQSLGILGILGIAFLTPHNAYAFFQKTEQAENYMILPNESAFWIVDVAPGEKQTAFDSAKLLNEKKIASGIIKVTHHLLPNGYGGWSFDPYVPDGRLFIVSRTPYSRKWNGHANKGTSTKNQEIECQDSGGLTIKTGISISAYIEPQNAALYMYNFGVLTPAGDPKSGEYIFNTVYYSTSLADVMDDAGYNTVETLVCNELAASDLDTDNKNAVQIMNKVREETRTEFAKFGITLRSIGWSATWEYDDAVQKALNDRYVAKTVRENVKTLQDLADIKVKEGLGVGLAQKGLPSNLISAPANQLEGVGLGPILHPAQIDTKTTK